MGKRKKTQSAEPLLAKADEFEKPPYSLRINRKKKEVVLRCTLHKIPPLLITFEPTPNELVLHTLRYSKKYYLKVPYPEDVTVQASEDTEASLENGILTAVFPITSDLTEDGSSLGKRRSIEEANTPPKKKQKLVQSDQEPDQPPKKKSKQTKEKKTSKPNHTESMDQDMEKSKPKKQFATKESALELIDQVTQIVEDNINKKLAKEQAKIEWQTERKAIREKRKKGKQSKKQEEIEEIIHSLKEQKKKKKQQAQKEDKEDEEGEGEEMFPKPLETGLKSILKTTKISRSRSVSFSPNLVQVKPIPRVRAKTPIATLTLPPVQLRSQSKKKMSRKAKLSKRRR